LKRLQFAETLLTCKHGIRKQESSIMATTQTKNGEHTFDQFRDLNDQWLAAARKAGTTYLDSYEKAVARTTDLELKFAGLSQQEWLKSLIEAQVDVTRELTSSYTTAARTFLK
jgi:hypothetical protein